MDGLDCSVVTLSEVRKSTNYFRLEAEYFGQWLSRFDSMLGDEIIEFVQYGTSTPCDEIQEDFPVLRLNELDNCFIKQPQKYCHTMDNMEFESLRLVANDVVVIRTNGNPDYVGKAAIVKEDTNFAYASYLYRVRTNEKMGADSFVAFLNCKYGRAEIDKNSIKGNQTNFSPEKLKAVNFPVLSADIQEKIRSLFDTSYDYKIVAQAKYSEAEYLLLSSLGLDNFKPSKQNTSIKKFSDVKSSERLDAEYYQVKYDELKERIRSYAESVVLVKNISIENNRGVQPDYIDNGEIAVVNSKNILENGLDYDGFSATSRIAWKLNPKAQIKQGDILIYTTGANIGRAAMYRPNTPALASNHVNILRVKHPHPQYIAFVINSMIGRLQTEQISTGSAQQELYPKDIEQFMIPLLAEDLQIKIESLLDKSFDLREQSKSLLKAATKAVEIAIEQNESAAMAYLEKQAKGDA